jgi:hypothetical protein
LLPNRLILPLLVAASVAFARGSFSHDTTPITTKHRSTKTVDALGTTLDVSVDGKDVNAEAVSFAFHVANNTKKMMELRFPNGQTHEFVVLDESGKEVWRWSSGRMFTQAIRNKLLKGREETVFEERWNTKGLRGTYTAIATLRSENHPVETSVEFVLP